MPKTIKTNIDGHVVILQELSPHLFIGGEIIPLSFFHIGNNSKTQYEQVLERVKLQKEHQKTSEDATKILCKVLDSGVLSIDGVIFNLDLFVKEIENIQSGKFKLPFAYKMFEHIINASFNLFKPKNNQPVLISKENAKTYHYLSKEYKKTPIEILCPNGGYTDMDAFTFNLAVFSIATEEKNAIVKKYKIQTVNTL